MNQKKYIQIPGFEGYMISPFGEIIRLAYDVQQINRWGQLITRHKPNRVIIPRISEKGYARAAIIKNKSVKTFGVHRMVALAYIPNEEKFDQINHIDGNKLNNHYSNLEWCNSSHNVQHSYDLKLNVAASGWEDTSSKPIRLFYQGKLIWVFGSIGEASKLTMLKRETISRNCRSKSPLKKQHRRGYKFEYL